MPRRVWLWESRVCPSRVEAELAGRFVSQLGWPQIQGVWGLQQFLVRGRKLGYFLGGANQLRRPKHVATQAQCDSGNAAVSGVSACSGHVLNLCMGSFLPIYLPQT